MTKFTYAALSAATSLALFGGALTPITPAPAKAYDLNQDSFSHDIWDRPTYNQGNYTELDRNDLQRSSLYDSTIQDGDGNLYDCDDFMGTCSSRW